MAGSSTGSVSPPLASRHSPATNSCFRVPSTSVLSLPDEFNLWSFAGVAVDVAVHVLNKLDKTGEDPRAELAVLR